MTVIAPCYRCGGKMVYRDSVGMQHVRCPKCGQMFFEPRSKRTDKETFVTAWNKWADERKVS